MISLVAFALALSGRVEAAAPEDEVTGPVSVDASPQLFATMCGLMAAGLEAGSASGNPSLVQLQTQLRALHGPATEALRAYYRQHALADPGSTLSRFVTFALSAGPAPKFEPVLKREQLSPDLLVLDGFSQVLANFYEEAQIERLWREFQPAYERAASSIREQLGQTVLVSSGYLRELVRPGARTFTVYVEPMVGKETNLRNIGDKYVVVMSPASASFDAVRHAFLHYLLDTLPLRYKDKLVSEQPLLLIANRAPRLPYEYHTDLTSFFTECFVRAVELRVRRLPPAQLAVEVNRAEGDGYVLVRPLIKALSQFESSQPAMSYYFPDLVRSIDVISERQRLQTVTFASASDSEAGGGLVEGRAAGKQNARDPASDLEAELNAAERMIAERNAASAAEAFEGILQKIPGQPRALYGLAVASVLQGDAERARTLFQQVVTAADAEAAEMRPEPAVLAWSHVYLGRMNDLEGDRDQAVGEYRAALAIENASETARSAAQRGIAEAYQPAAGKKTSPE